MPPRHDRAAFTPIHDAMSRAVADRVFPGAVLLIDAGGEIVLHQAFGHAALVPAPEPMTADTVFDVASLTKPLVTATLTLALVADGRLALDAPIGRHVPSWREGAKARATIRHLLTHTSGLPAWEPFYQLLEPAPLATPPGKRRGVA